MTDQHAEPAPGEETPEGRAEAIRAAAVAEAPKHRHLLESPKDGRVLSTIMRRALAAYTPPGHGVLTTTGRRTGRQRRNYVRAIRRQDTVYVVMLRPPALAIERPEFVSAWVWNIRSDPRVRLRLGRRTFAGAARELSDPAELARAREVICETVHRMDFGECVLHLRGLPTPAKIRDLHRYWFDTGVPLVIELGK